MVMVGSNLGLICSGGCEFQCGGGFAMGFLDLGFVAMGLVRFCGQRWFLVVVVVCFDMGWICGGDCGGFAIGFLDLGFARGFG